MAAVGTFESLLRSQLGFRVLVMLSLCSQSAFMFCEKSWWKHINMLPRLGAGLNRYLNFVLLQKRQSCVHKELICDWVKQSVKLGLSSAAFLSPRHPCLFVTDIEIWLLLQANFQRRFSCSIKCFIVIFFDKTRLKVAVGWKEMQTWLLTFWLEEIWLCMDVSSDPFMVRYLNQIQYIWKGSKKKSTC